MSGPAGEEGATLDRLDEALAWLDGKPRCLVLTHNNPDPDSIAAAFVLATLFAETTSVEVTMGYGGVIGRAENRAMVHLLDIPLHLVTRSQLHKYDAIALVDSQPGAGNNILTLGHQVDFVVDHHPRRQWSLPSRWVDVRSEAGATTTMAYGYLEDHGIEPAPALATAIVYGIISDTLDLGRGATERDFEVYLSLLPKCDVKALSMIRNPELPLVYYRIIADSLQLAVRLSDAVVALTLVELPYPDLTAELADLLSRAEGIRMSFCTGYFERKLFMSIRARGCTTDAGMLIRSLVGERGAAGGHGYMAGGVIEVASAGEALSLGKELVQTLSKLLDLEGDPKPFVPRDDRVGG